MKTIKCPNTIKGMVNALGRKYPGQYININKQHRLYQSAPKEFCINHGLYISEFHHEMDLTWNDLKTTVAEILNKET